MATENVEPKNRTRGVVLTPQGAQRLQEAITQVEIEENSGQKLTIEELSNRTGLHSNTIDRVLRCEEGVDSHTLDQFFHDFNLDLVDSDYCASGTRQPESVAEEPPDSRELVVEHIFESVFRLMVRRERKQARYFVEKLGDTLGLDMILLPGGTFTMGSPDDEPERTKAEEPQHEVNIPRFFMGRYPVTQAQWQFVAALPQVKQELNLDPSRFKGDNRPVESVSWYDAIEFCDRLSTYTGREYRLPTEAEWECACRAGTTTPFYFGKTLTPELANHDNKFTYEGSYTYNGNYTYGEHRQETTPVDHFGIANAFGLCDMHGNAYEWCLDHWHDSYEGAPTDGSAWLSKDENASRVGRGGSWVDGSGRCRSAYRLYNSPAARDFIIGFRVVCVALRAQ